MCNIGDEVVLIDIEGIFVPLGSIGILKKSSPQQEEDDCYEVLFGTISQLVTLKQIKLLTGIAKVLYGN